MIFLPTPSARRATAVVVRGAHVQAISTHALREEGDASFRRTCRVILFLPTPSARRATVFISDIKVYIADFYPRPPRGGRRSCVSFAIPQRDFYPRPPRGGRRPHHGSRGIMLPISTHALREEGDPQGHVLLHLVPISTHGPSPRTAPGTASFLPTPSARRATPDRGRQRRRLVISTHALREEGDRRPPAPG